MVSTSVCGAEGASSMLVKYPKWKGVRGVYRAFLLKGVLKSTTGSNPVLSTKNKEEQADSWRLHLF